MIIAQDLTLRLGSKKLFDSVSFNFDKSTHTALVGRNGTGKTTLLNAIAGNQGLDGGSLSIQKGAKIAYMQQEDVLASSNTILDETLAAVGDIVALNKEAAELEKLFEKESHDAINQDDLDRYAHLQEKISELNIDTKRVEAEQILCGLGLASEQLNQPVTTLSVGWKMRVVLAKLLLQDADFYLFDEPTNHLDIFAKDWFLGFLQKAPFGYLLVSHDRFFLDKGCDKIFELDRGKGRLYHGNYSHFVQQKEAEKEELQKAYVAQQKEIKRRRATIERFRAKATKAKMAKSMEKALDKVEMIEVESEMKGISLSFPGVERAGNIVLTVKNAEKSFGDKQIFKDVEFELKRGSKAAIVASNGKGKTTLFNFIAGRFPDAQGTVAFGHNVDWSLFEQDQTKVLDPKKSILEEVEDACPNAEARQRVRSLLGAFLFPGEDVLKKTGVLSGGEKNRVAMVKVLLQKANLLLLDEPTNHLDIQSKEIFLGALQQFPGTILFVSHDRFFLDQLATTIFELTSDGLITYQGNYEAYLYHKHHQMAGAGETSTLDVSTSSKPKVSGKDDYQRAKKRKKLEAKIERYEHELAKITKEFEDVSYKPEEFEDKHKRFQDLQKLLDSCYQEWEDLAD